MPVTYKYVFEFNEQRVDGDGDMKDMLGGKGAGLAHMAKAGLPVPPGFTVSTEACHLFLEDRGRFDDETGSEIREALQRLEETSGKKFGATNNALLISVRSGAKFSMPGMMDTVLNLGLNDQTVKALAEETGNPRFAYDSYRRLLQMFGDVVLGVPEHHFEEVLAGHTTRRQVSHEIELEVQDLKEICEEFKSIIAEDGKEFPQDPYRQLEMAIEAVFLSWDNPRAKTYRRLNDIPEDLGTAVNVQVMVFGNRGERSGSGVGFTRNPATGEKHLYGEYLPQAQGEEVVAGTRTPLPVDKMKQQFPEIHAQLLEISDGLEKLRRDMQDFEFTLEDGHLYMLQTRDGKRTGPAAVKIALDMVDEGLITPREALLRVEPDQLDQLLHPVFKDEDAVVIARGLPASPGAAVGKIVFSADDAEHWAARGEKVVLARPETTPDDIHGMEAAVAILTSRGGMTSHAAVVARGMGKCSVVGCESLRIDPKNKIIESESNRLNEGDVLSLDGTTGRVMLGAVEMVDTGGNRELLDRFMTLVGQVDAMGVRANADQPDQASIARDFGAIGIGLCRTEHMFFEEDRLPLMQEMILSDSVEKREEALGKLKRFQRSDFEGILEAMDGLPVTIRLLDPPLHEFLPPHEAVVEKIQKLRQQGADETEVRRQEDILKRIESLHEANPMLGHRGCRLGITYPEITRMQTQAIIEAACRLKKAGKNPIPEIMVPLVSMKGELTNQADVVRKTADEILQREGIDLHYLVGTMIELPRACLVADELAEISEFFSFGTNDLTQTTFGFSRDDAVKFLGAYEKEKILAKDPFQTLDQSGVGQLVEMAVKKGRRARSDIKVGICGEHGGDPASIEFCHGQKLDYVSCSPFRVPGARLASAHCAIRDESKSEGGDVPFRDR